MPIDTYRCSRGHQFDAIVKMDRSDAPTHCHCIEGRFETSDPATGEETRCDAPIEKQLALNAKSFPGADSWRK